MNQGYAPQYGIKVMPKGEEMTPRGQPKLMLVLSVIEAASQHDFYLCDVSDNFQEVGAQLAKRINEAGREGRRAESGLVVVEGGSDGFRADRAKQGGKLISTSGTSPEGPRPA